MLDAISVISTQAIYPKGHEGTPRKLAYSFGKRDTRLAISHFEIHDRRD
jgi:hypothetical protein